MPDLTDLLRAVRARGFVGFAVIDQGGPDGVLAGCLTRDGRFTCPTWDTHPTAAAALTQLAAESRTAGEGKPRLECPYAVGDRVDFDGD